MFLANILSSHAWDLLVYLVIAVYAYSKMNARLDRTDETLKNFGKRHDKIDSEVIQLIKSVANIDSKVEILIQKFMQDKGSAK